MVSSVLALLLLAATAASRRGCVPQNAKHGLVCVCNATYCDDIEPVGSVPLGSAAVYASSEAGDRLERTERKSDASKSQSSPRTITFNVSQTYQTIKGFGNAFTDAAALNFYKMSNSTQEVLLDQYWGARGMGLSVGRVPIASCDFSTHVYSYDDVDGDVNLTHFSVAMDDAQKIPLIRRAMDRLRAGSGRNMSLYASPWAPPYWMTDKNKTTDNPKLKGGPTGATARVYAQYLVKFFEAYAERGLRFWALTAQNEPAGNTGAWQELKFSAEEQRDFIRDVLGPALSASDATRDVDLLILDDQRVHLPTWADTVLSDDDAAQYVKGIGVHWYAAVEDHTPSELYFGKLSETHDKHSDYYIYGTEACEGFLPWSQGVYLGDWTRAETYAHDIMGDLNNWAVGWNDWNAFLDMEGGPNWAKNVVDAPIILDTNSGGASESGATVFYKQPMYYALSHFAAFVPPGSVRIAMQSRSSSALDAPMEAAAFLRPDNLVALVVINRGFKVSSSTEYSVELPGGGFVNMDVPSHSMQTILFPVSA